SLKKEGVQRAEWTSAHVERRADRVGRRGTAAICETRKYADAVRDRAGGRVERDRDDATLADGHRCAVGDRELAGARRRRRVVRDAHERLGDRRIAHAETRDDRRW